MRITKKIRKLMSLVVPKSEIDEILYDISLLDKSNPINFIKLADLHIRLHNVYTIKHGHSTENLYGKLANIHYDIYKKYMDKAEDFKMNAKSVI